MEVSPNIDRSWQRWCPSSIDLVKKDSFRLYNLSMDISWIGLVFNYLICIDKSYNDWFTLCHLSMRILDGLDGLISMDISNTGLV